jgi:hypothetical protein
MTDTIAEWVDERTSRRGFLGRTGKVLAGVGFGLLAGGVTAGVAGAVSYCCTGTQCLGCPATIGQCPSGYTYTGYTWICCESGFNPPRAVYCWDCQRSGTKCFCNKVGGQICD